MSTLVESALRTREGLKWEPLVGNPAIETEPVQGCAAVISQVREAGPIKVAAAGI